MSSEPEPATGRYWSVHPWRGVGIWRYAHGGTSHGPLFRLVFPGIWLVYLIPVAAEGFGHRHFSGLYHLGVAAVVAGFAVIYLVVVGWWDRYPRVALPGCAAMAAITTAACLFYGGGATPLWIYVAVATGLAIDPQWLAMRALCAVVVAFAGFSLAGHPKAGDFLSVLLPLVFGGLAALGFRARYELTRELLRAREQVALLAASEERLRLARDMHDLTGQSLSMITLKADLAARLLSRLPESAERDRASDEVRQVADVSREALRDVREALSGYRRPTLAVEAITARAALSAAGIDCHDDSALTMLSGSVDPDAEAALAWCLREAVTNVIRHSGARHCWLRLCLAGGELALEVRDDGRGAAGVGGAGGAADDGHSGLRGMSERLSAVGGRLEIRPSGSGFCLVARVPARETASVAP